VHQVVLGAVGRRVAQHRQRTERGQRGTGPPALQPLRFVEDEHRPAPGEHVDRAAALEVVEFLVDAPALGGRVERLRVDHHHVDAGIGGERLQPVQFP
jgi:hypothetical protein